MANKTISTIENSEIIKLQEIYQNETFPTGSEQYLALELQIGASFTKRPSSPPNFYEEGSLDSLFDNPLDNEEHLVENDSYNTNINSRGSVPPNSYEE